MSEIWFIRHGESESNAGLRTGATMQIALTPRGRAQAQAVAAAFERAPDLIVASSYRRAIDTAQTLRERFPAVPYEEWPIHECVTLADVRRNDTTPEQRRPLIAAYWERCDPRYVDGAGAESFVQLIERAAGFLGRLQQLDHLFVAIVGHGLFTRTALWVHLAAPTLLDAQQMRAYRSFLSGFRVSNASIIKVYRNPQCELLFGAPSVAHLPEHLREIEQPVAVRGPQED
jgi:2,3-bisphosphoglycerate-dependent phosphoglycerate mutase